MREILGATSRHRLTWGGSASGRMLVHWPGREGQVPPSGRMEASMNHTRPQSQPPWTFIKIVAVLLFVSLASNSVQHSVSVVPTAFDCVSGPSVQSHRVACDNVTHYPSTSTCNQPYETRLAHRWL